jgi:hypothetical protein
LFQIGEISLEIALVEVQMYNDSVVLSYKVLFPLLKNVRLSAEKQERCCFLARSYFLRRGLTF